MSDERFQKKIEGILEALRITLQVIADLQTTTTLPKKRMLLLQRSWILDSEMLGDSFYISRLLFKMLDKGTFC